MFGISAFSEAPFSALAGSDSASVNVSLTGQAGTGAVGSFTFVGKANVTPASQVGTSALGTATVDAEANCSADVAIVIWPTCLTRADVFAFVCRRAKVGVIFF